MKHHNPPPHPHHDTTPEPPRGAAREYLEKERQRTEAAARSRAAADKRAKKTAEKQLLTHGKFGNTGAYRSSSQENRGKQLLTPFWLFAAVILAQNLVLARFIGRWPALLVGLFVFLVVFPYVRRAYRNYRRRRHDNHEGIE